MAQKTTYPGIANSPKTFLTAGITAIETTIAVDSAAGFPPAPNLATIGTGDDAEVVRYNDVSGLTLTGCERGFGGTTAKVWAADTLIYRAITQYDIDTANENIADLDSTKLAKTGDGKDVTVTASAAAERANIASGEKLAVTLGKLMKWFMDFKALAWKTSVGAADIDASAVTNEKLANMPAKTIKGNRTDENAAPADITVTQMLELLELAGAVKKVDGTAADSAGNVALGAEKAANKVTSISGASTDVQYPTAKCMYDAIKDIRKNTKRYGVKFTGSASAGERLYDAVGLVAGVGTNTETAINDFDRVMPWAGMRRCNTAIVNGDRVPTAFEDEPGYSNTDGDVFVYVPLFYYYRSADDGEHVVSMSPLPGYRAPKKFHRADGTLRDHAFLAAYTAGADANGVPVSRSGYYPYIMSLNNWMSILATKHTASALAGDIWIEGTADDEIKNILLDIEFATRDHQNVMAGATSMRYASDVATVGGTNQFTLPVDVATKIMVGQAIAIGTSEKTQDIATNATVTAVNATTGVITFVSETGTSVAVAAGNYISSRPWKAGACDSVLSSSGSLYSNTSGYNPCKYRGIENPWGNLWRWRWDYMQNNHAPSVLLDPTKYAAGAISADYHALSYNVPTSNGYTTEMGYDANHPHVRITNAIGGTSSTYFADYFYQTSGVRALLVGGYLSNGRGAGSRYFGVGSAPSDSAWSIGSALSPA